MKKLIDRFLTMKTRTIISVLVIISGIFFIYNFSFKSPTYINKIIATKIYKDPANSAFNDQNFYNCIIDSYNTANSTNLAYTHELDDEELAGISALSCPSYEIADVSGIEKIINLEYLNLSSNVLTEIDLQSNTMLEYVDLNNNDIDMIDLTGLTELKRLLLQSNAITEINLSSNVSLKELNLGFNNLASIDLENNIGLEILYLNNNDFDEVILNANSELIALHIETNNIETLDVTNMKNLIELYIGYNTISEINLENNVNLEVLDATSMNTVLTSLDVSKNGSLKHLLVGGNFFESLDLRDNPLLEKINAADNELTSIDLSNCLALMELNISDNRLEILNIAKNINIRKLDASNNSLESLDLNNNVQLTDLNLSSNFLTDIDLSENSNLETLILNDNPFSIEIRMNKGQSVDLADYLFKMPQGVKSTIVGNQASMVGYTIANTIITATQAGNYSENVNVSYTLNNETNLYGLDIYLRIYEVATLDNQIELYDDYVYYFGELDNEWFVSMLDIDPTGEGIIKDDKLKIIDEEVVREYDIVNISSDKYLLDDCVYYQTDNQNEILNNIDTINATASIQNNTLLLSYKGNVIKEYDLVGISSDKYDLSKPYINYEGDAEDILKDITVVNGTAEIIDNALCIIHDESVLQEFLLLPDDDVLESTDYTLDNNNLILSRVDSFDITEVYGKITTSADLSILDYDGNVVNSIKTGYILRATFSTNLDNPLNYKISIVGDVLGEGKISKNGAKKVAKEIIDTGVLQDEYLLSADMDGDTKVKVNDVSKMLRKMVSQNNG